MTWQGDEGPLYLISLNGFTSLSQLKCCTLSLTVYLHFSRSSQNEVMIYNKRTSFFIGLYAQIFLAFAKLYQTLSIEIKYDDTPSLIFQFYCQNPTQLNSTQVSLTRLWVCNPPRQTFRPLPDHQGSWFSACNPILTQLDDLWTQKKCRP